VQRGETDMLDARGKRMLNTIDHNAVVEARDVDVIHRAVGRVGHGRLEVHAREGRRRVGVGHVDEGDGMVRLLLLLVVMLEVNLALLRERGKFRGKSEKRRGKRRGEGSYMRRGEGGGVDVEPGLLQHLREVWLRKLRLADALTRTLRGEPRASSKSSRRYKSRKVGRLVGSCRRSLFSRRSSSSAGNRSRNGSGRGSRSRRDTRNIVDLQAILIRSKTLRSRGLLKIAKVHSTVCC
jgi:hypothetical protein